MGAFKFTSVSDWLSRLPQAIQSIPDILRNPAANPMGATLLLGIAVMLVLIAALTIFLLVLRPSREEREMLAQEVVDPDESDTEEDARERATRRRLLVARIVTWTCLAFLLAIAAWVTAGISTASSDVCLSCHTRTSHDLAGEDDPHRKVWCVDCHEGGGILARVTVNVLTRGQHVIRVRINPSLARGYGKPISSDRCYACHRGDIATVYTDRTLQVRMSHKEPVEADVPCVTCHSLSEGMVSRSTVGMSTCLRCHDGITAKVGCVECHIGDASKAITPSIARDEMATSQVPNPGCKTCHTDMTRCNNCHGLDMPHSVEFKMYKHARAGALDIWDNNQQVCRRCHYPLHNNCQQNGCHVGPFPSHGPKTWKKDHGGYSWSSSALTCSCHQWNEADHNGVNFCVICHDVKPKGTVK